MRQTIFEQRKEKFEALSKSYANRYNQIATIRISLFIAFLVALIWFANAGDYAIVTGMVLFFPLVFGLIVRRHNKVRFNRDQNGFLSGINDQEVYRYKGELFRLEEGNEFQNELHPYSYDLDIFGRNSLFQLLSRASTPSGKNVLAKWLLKPASNVEIMERQGASRELGDMLDWRQELQALGLHDHDKKRDLEKLDQWLAEPVQNRPVWLSVLGIVMPLLALVSLSLTIFNDLSIYYFFGVLVINGVILLRFMDRVKKITEDTSANVGLLKAYSRLVEKIEQTKFESEYLKTRREHFSSQSYSASQSILQLQKLLDFLNARSNLFYGIIDLVLLMDVHLVIRTEKWKSKNAEHASKWFEIIGECEALCSLAAFSYAHPDYAYPEIVDHDFHYNGKGLGHPLIFTEERVTNDFSLEGRGQTAVITGSNMSGKSTFLRTIGINAVLAHAGAPCCAKELKISNLQVFTGMRTQDNLEEHVSSFYAELKRIRQLLDRVEKRDKPVLFLLDEILKGTNSKDRHLGSIALVKQLSDQHTFGLVSTHDLELGELATNMTNVRNYSFNSQIKGDEILFDYTLTEGLCNSFNASKLMEKMGIDLSWNDKLR